MGTKAPADQSNIVGCFVQDETSHRLIHCAEKPETYVSDLINCGIYCLSPEIFTYISIALENLNARTNENFEWYYSGEVSRSKAIGLERDVIVPLAGTAEFYIFEYKDFWRQLKSSASAIYCTELYMKYYAKTKPHLLARPTLNIRSPSMIHPTASIHPTAVIGPNVYIGENVTIGKGVRITQSIIMDNCKIGDQSLVCWSILACDCKIGYWSRVQGFPSPSPSLMDIGNPKDTKGIAILGTGSIVASEVMILNCIVMPHKELNSSFSDEILL